MNDMALQRLVVPDDLPADHVSFVEARQHLLDQENAPKPYKPEAAAEAKTVILAELERAALAYCAGVDGEGWPFGFVAPFVSVTGEDQRPIVYLWLTQGSQALAQVQADPRISVGTYFATGFEQRRQAKALQIQGLASVVGSDATLDAAFSALQLPPSFLPDAGMTADTRVLVRVDSLAAVLFNASGRPQWGFLDYAKAHG